MIMERDVVVQVENFRKTYGDYVAVNGISFSVRQGEIFGLLGPNGAGKTSTLESLEGLRKPDGGVVRVAGVDPAREGHQLRKLIGVQLQSSGMPDSIRVDESMRLFCSYRGAQPRFDLLDRLGLGDKKKVLFHQLSTGQQRRLALALAISHQPKVVFLDEPTAGLDVPSRVELHTIMRELKSQGTSIILATHDMAEAEDLSDRIAILLNGSIVATGTPLEITATGAGFTKISVSTTGGSLARNGVEFPAVHQVQQKDNYSIYFSTDIGATVSAVIEYIKDKSDSVIDLRVERPSLEDRFLELTNGGKS
jgi:ABC-2 type transport system ATP-binding protein